MLALARPFLKHGRDLQIADSSDVVQVAFRGRAAALQKHALVAVGHHLDDGFDLT
jgi:hypothetical protein